MVTRLVVQTRFPTTLTRLKPIDGGLAVTNLRCASRRHASTSVSNALKATIGSGSGVSPIVGYALAGLVFIGGIGLETSKKWRMERAKVTSDAVEAKRREKEARDRELEKAAALKEQTADEAKSSASEEDDDATVIHNWSNTHGVSLPAGSYKTPTTLPDLEQLVREAHESGTSLRPIGSALSPNGIGLHSGGMVNLALLDKLVSVDAEKKQVTVQAGARIDQLVEYIRPYGLTLPTYASIREQQVGGFTQMAAHGTGIGVPSVDGLVSAVKVVTPGLGTITLSENDEDVTPFLLARCGMGAMGIVAEVTLNVVPAHRLVEKTFVATRKDIEKNHLDWIKKHQHVRYMWIPHTEDVVVVYSDPEGSEQAGETLKWWDEQKTAAAAAKENNSDAGSLAKLSEPYKAIFAAHELPVPNHTTAIQLRDHLYNLDPLNPPFVQQINKASAEFWRRNQGVRVDWSDKILGFDCGGEQWVDESCFRAPELTSPTTSPSEPTSDIRHTEAILDLISEASLPAHEPIEQRWSQGSLSPLAPCFSPDGKSSIFSWVGIIMYLPPASEPGNAVKRVLVTEAFNDYVRKVYAETSGSDPMTHLAKIEYGDDANVDEWKAKFKGKMGEVNWGKVVEWKQKVDPKGILDNAVTARLFRPENKE